MKGREGLHVVVAVVSEATAAVLTLRGFRKRAPAIQETKSLAQK